MQLIDTHCHIHEAWRSVNGQDATAKLWDKAGRPAADDIIARALEAGVQQMICVGTTLPDSRLVAEFVASRKHTWGSIGLHPHEAKDYAGHPKKLAEFASIAEEHARGGGHGGTPAARNAVSTVGEVLPDRTPHANESPRKIVAIGECGLDYFHNHSPKPAQEKVLRFQIELALEHGLPLIFHVRDAFADFWPIFDSYQGIRGVIHSFSAGPAELEQIVSRGLYVGLNGIMTFTKNPEQLAAAKAVPAKHLLLETDAPFLTPAPHRGSICEPRHVRVTAEFLADLQGIQPSALASATTRNAHDLFQI